MTSSFINLCNEPLVFEPISTMNCVFFDPANNQVFTLRARGAMGVNVKTLATRQANNFRIQDKGEVLSVKFNPTCSVLSLQRNKNSVNFINFENNRPEEEEYSQTCRNLSSQIIGYVWTQGNEIIFVTNEGFELFQVIPEKRALRLLKQGTVPTNWYTWDPLNRALLISSGDLGNHIHVISFEQPDSPSKLSGFEFPEVDIPPIIIESPSSPSGIKEGPCKLQQKNVLLTNLYGQLFACILSKCVGGGLELALYKLMRNGPVCKTHALSIPEQGRIALSFIDDIILVHHQQSSATLAYDIGLQGEVVDGVERHFPILPPMSLGQVSIPCKNIPSLSLEPEAEFTTPLYASSWIVFPPNVVIDGSLGCLWTVELDISAFTKQITDPAILINCLLKRTCGKSVLRAYCSQLTQQIISKTVTHDYEEVIGSPDIVCHCRSEGGKVPFLEEKNASTLTRFLSSKTAVCQPYKNPFVFTADDIYETIFLPLASHEDMRVQRVLSHAVLNYISTLKSQSLHVESILYESLVRSLVNARDFSRLAVIVQSRVLVDSKLIANQLLSIEALCPAAGMLALDMLQRLGDASESIMEIFLAKGDPISALRFCKAHRELLCLPDTPRKILDVAKSLDDQMVFYSVFRFFEQAVPVLQDKKYQPYVAHFVSLFGTEGLSKKHALQAISS